MIKTIKTSKIYRELLEAESANKYNIILLEGGSRSSKTWSIFQFFIIKALQGERFDVTISRAYLQLAKDTILEDLKEMWYMYDLPLTPDININRSTQKYNILNGEFLFWGLDKPRKAHGKKQKYAWMNEVMEIPNKAVLDQLEMRTTDLIIIDYNPSDDAHWVFDLKKRPDVKTLHSTMLDNPFLEEKIVNKIKGYEPTEENIKNGTADSYMWDVYGLGKPAKLKGVVFNNWEKVETIPEKAQFLGYGQDFGFTNDPATLIALYRYDGAVYWDELLYKKELTNDDLIKEYERLGVKRNELIIADSAEPKSIEEIRRANYRIGGADKGRDSVRHGISLLKGYKMYVTERSVHLEQELRKYKWKEDKTGKPTQDPIDDFNHCIDAMRYIGSKVLRRNSDVQIRERVF